MSARTHLAELTAYVERGGDLDNANARWLLQLLRSPVPARTLRDAQARFVEDLQREGHAACPCCAWEGGYDHRAITPAQARALIVFARTQFRDSEGWITVSKLSDTSIRRNKDYQRLRHWGLIEAKPEEKGVWRITSKGLDFIHGRVTVPSHLWIYRADQVVSPPQRCEQKIEPQVTIYEALGDRYDYEELMNG